LDEAAEWTKQAHAEFDQENAKFQSERRQAVASGLADALDETLGAQFAQVVAQLAEAVVVSGEVMTSDDACVQLAGGPVVDEPTGMKQRLSSWCPSGSWSGRRTGSWPFEVHRAVRPVFYFGARRPAFRLRTHRVAAVR